MSTTSPIYICSSAHLFILKILGATQSTQQSKVNNVLRDSASAPPILALHPHHQKQK